MMRRLLETDILLSFPSPVKVYSKSIVYSIRDINVKYFQENQYHIIQQEYYQCQN